ncbi:twin-arginine translocation signal domain-containing protein, partial [Escherichia coli]
MTWSRRQFLTGVGVLAAVSGTAPGPTISVV